MPTPEDQPAEIEPSPIGPDASGTDHSLEKTQFFADDSSPTNSGSKSATSSDSHPSASKKSQKTVGGYRLIKLLGEGGMGRVHQAADESGRMVAIKLLSPELSRSPEALDRFKLEGVIASAISHPNCVFVHRADEDAGTPFIAMELMTGQTLKDIVSKRGPLPYAEAIPLILQSIDGLIEAHSRGMIHRDVKPANCYLDDQGNVKIGDFGLARSLVSDSELTRTGSFLGTPLYASPEQILGEKVDEQSDIYSLAATIYFLLAGKAPFESPHATQVIAKIVSADPPTFVEAGVQIPKKLEQVVLRGLARDRSKRYANFHEFRDELIQTIAQRDRVATLLRRILAYMIDSFLVSIAMGSATLALLAYGFQMKSGYQMQQLSLNVNLLATLLQGLYLLAFESLFGTTIGKRLLSLRVVDPQLGTRPKFVSCLVRTVVFLAVLSAIEFSASIFLSPVDDFIWYSVFSWVGIVVGCVAILSVWKRSNRKELLHEKISKTQTWVSTEKTVLGAVDLPTPRWSMSTKPVDLAWEVPTRLGRFEIVGKIPTVDHANWLLAHDSKIERSVWIQLSPATNPPPSESREKCVRGTRMRFLETGILGSWRWDAYVAPDGAPLALWFDYRNPMPWPVTQKVLLSALDETEASECRPDENATAMSRWWLTSTGKLTLSEAAISTDGAKTSAVSSSSPKKPIPLLSELACLAIPDKNRTDRVRIERTPQSSSAMPVAPLQATQLLQKLKSGKLIDPKWIRGALDKVTHGPQSVTVTMRVVHAAILSIVAFIPWIILTTVIMLAAVIPIVEVQKDARSFTTLAALFRDPENHTQQMQKLDAAKRSEYGVNERIASIENAANERFERFSKAHKSLGFLESGIIDLMNRFLGRDDFTAKPVPDFSRIAGSEEAKSAATEKEKSSGPQISVNLPNKSEKLRLDQKPEAIDVIVERFERYEAERKAPPPVKWFNRTRDILIIPFCVLVVWGGLFRGGLIHAVTGLAVVRRDGRRGRILQCSWRSFLFWAPFFLVAGGIVILDAHGLEWVWWTQQLRRIYFMLPIAYLVVVIRWPSRGPHDLASGTYVVPR